MARLRVAPGARFLAAWLVLAATAAADPPAVSSLFPAGVQRGATADVNLNGKSGSPPLSVWCDREGIELTPSEKGDRLSITVPADAPPGLCFLRVYNHEGASNLLPLMIGLLPELNEQEPNNSRSQATPIDKLPVVVNGTLHRSGELDTFAVPLQEGETFIASVDALRPFGSPMDAVLQLVSPDGFVLEQNDDHHGFDPQIEWRVERSGTYALRIFAFPSQPNSTIGFSGGTDYVYRLTLTTGPFLDQFPPPSNPARRELTDLCGWNLRESSGSPSELPGLHQALPPPALDAVIWEELLDSQSPLEIKPSAHVIGHLKQPGESDSIPLKGTKGERWRLRVQAQAFGSPLDPVLRILDADGKQVAQADDVSRSDRDIDLSWSPPADGLYQLVISERFGHGGLRYVYHLLIDADRPRFELSLDADHYVLKGDKTLEIPVSISRSGGFDEEITVTALGLPDDVQVSEAVSKSRGDSARKVTLRLKADQKGAFNGLIGIVGRTGGETPREVAAVAATRAAGWTTSSVWLTQSP